MGESSTSAAMCKLCGHRHRMMDPHVWDTAVKGDRKITVEDLRKGVSRVHRPEKAKDVYTVRQVSIRQLRANLAGELRNLPFDIIKSGAVIAAVITKE